LNRGTLIVPFEVVATRIAVTFWLVSRRQTLQQYDTRTSRVRFGSKRELNSFSVTTSFKLTTLVRCTRNDFLSLGGGSARKTVILQPGAAGIGHLKFSTPTRFCRLEERGGPTDSLPNSTGGCVIRVSDKGRKLLVRTPSSCLLIGTPKFGLLAIG
jgi:hypothetical protein